jgi:HK97 family phage portal protein
VSDEGEEDIENHPWERLWEQPNPFFGRASLMAYWAWSLLLTGEAYLFLRPVGGQLKEIWPIPPWAIEPIPDPQAFIAGYKYDLGPDKAPMRIDSKYIVYSRLTNIFDPRRGMSPLVSALVAVESDLSMRAWNKNFFSKENAAPSGMITVPRDTLDSDMDVIRQQIWDYFGSGQRRVGVARAGDLAWTAFDRSQKDMEFLSGREFARTEISRAFGIPDGYWDKDATRANAEGAKATMIETAVWPKLVLLMEDFNAQATPNWIEDDDVRITFEDIRPRNVSQELQEFTTHSPVLTVNELRALAHYDPLPDYRGLMTLDELKKGAPLPTTVPALLAEQTAAQQAEQEEAAAPAAEEAAAEEAAPAEQEAPLEEQPDAEMKRWERKALKALKRSGSASVAFVSSAIDAATKASVTAALATARTPAEVREAFAKALDVPRVSAEEAADVLRSVDDEALRWARWALEERS